jgi:hypothetical protein
MSLSDDTFETHQFDRDEDLDQTGVSEVIVQQFMRYRLPQLNEMKDEVDEGKVLSDGEIELLTRMVRRANDFENFVYEHPELKTLTAKVFNLIDEITDKAVANAEAKAGD